MRSRQAFLALVLAGGLAAGGVHAQSAEQAPQAQAVIDQQIKAFRQGAHDQAFSYAAPTLQQIFRTTDNFTAMVKRGYMPIYGARAWRFGRAKAQGRRLFQEVMLTGPNGRSWVALYTMVKGPDGEWRIGGVRIVPGNDVAT